MTLNTILAMQLDQQRHDDVAHQDILALPVHQRITHMVLHFAKYTGRFLNVSKTDDLLVRLLVDTAIIALSSANILRLRLDKQLEPTVPDVYDASLMTIGAALATEQQLDVDLNGPIGQSLALHTGAMAKACEALDHLEATTTEQFWRIALPPFSYLFWPIRTYCQSISLP